jgi:predicted amidohydrolase
MGSQMTAGGVTTIRVAAVQAQSLPGQIQANLDHAAGLVDQAAAQGPR